MLHALRSQSPARSIYNGEIYVICNLAHTELCCTKQEIVALRPFRVKQLGHEESKCSYSLVVDEICWAWSCSVINVG
jgi:hypothetical protein